MLKIGDKAPNFMSKNQIGEEIELKSALAQLKNEDIEFNNSLIAHSDSLNVDVDLSRANASVDNEILNEKMRY